MRILLLSLALLMAATGASAQLQLPVPSPRGTVTQQVGLTTITVTYSRPSSRGRAIWGNVVAYNELWRTGANAATTVQFSHEVKVGGTTVPAGTYALLTIPTETTWTVVLNKNANLVGTNGYKQEEDAARITVTPRKGDYAETLTIGINNIKDNSCDLELKWDELVVPINVEVEVNQRALSNINSTLGNTPRLYAQAAEYLLNRTNELETAKTYAETAVRLREDVYNTLVLSRIQAKMGDYNTAVKTGERSLELAKAIADNPGTRDFFVQSNERNLAEWRPKMVPEKPAPKKRK